VDREAFVSLSRDDLVSLILAQVQQISLLTSRIAELEARLAAPGKNPDNSSMPPSKGQKANLPDPTSKKPRPRRPGVARVLAEHPDKVIAAMLAACPHCDHALGAEDQPEFHAYDHVELAPIRPVVTRINRHRGICPCCSKRFAAPAPEGFGPGSPFGPELCALVIHLHITQSISFERLACMMGEVFGVTISEGAIANILARAQAPLGAAVEPIAEAVRGSAVVGSDETSARVCGKNWWQWVLLSSTAICHVIVESRAADAVIPAFLAGRRPEIWVADRYGGQRHHGVARQMCLAHLLRDAKFAIEAGDTAFAPGFRCLLLRAVAIGKRRSTLKDVTLARYRADLDRRLDRLLSGPVPTIQAARRLFQAMRRDRDDLWRFVTRRDVPYTNNASERALRPSVIFRKVTNGFRSKWGAKLYANASSVIATGRLHAMTALEALRAALAGTPILQPG
jgi:transposase